MSEISRREVLKLGRAAALAMVSSWACSRIGGKDKDGFPGSGEKGEYGTIPEDSRFSLRYKGEYKSTIIRHNRNIDHLSIRSSGFGGVDDEGTVIFRPEEFVAGQKIARVPGEILEMNLYDLKPHPDAPDKGVGIWQTPWTIQGVNERVKYIGKSDEVVGLPVATIFKSDMWEGGEYEINQLTLGGESKQITNGWAIGKLLNKDSSTPTFQIEGFAPHHDVFAPVESF